MKTKIIIPVVLLVIIGILGGSLVYEVVQRHRAEDAVKAQAQLFIALGVVLYQGLERGDVEAVKQRLGGSIAANSLLYEQKYGHEVGTKFAPRLEEADVIREEFEMKNK